MNINTGNYLIKHLMYIVQHYNPNKYWRYRNIVIDPGNKTNKLIKFYMLFRIKKMDAFHNASLGTDLNKGAHFGSIPYLYHGLNGIIVSHYASIGENCTIYQQVTIAQDDDGNAPIIGDNCVIGAGAKIIGKVKIGNNVKIGANAVVVKDVPDHCTVVGIPGRIIHYAEG